MKKSQNSDSQVMAILKQAEAGTPVPVLCREHDMSSAAFYKWRAKFGGMDAPSLRSPWRAANVKNAVTGTYRAIRPQHLPRYPTEFCYRFNRRYHLKDMLPRFAYVAALTPPMPNRLLMMAESYG